MKSFLFISLLSVLFAASLFAQSRRVVNYSESQSSAKIQPQSASENRQTNENNEPDIIRVETDLVVIPTQITDRGGRVVTGIKKEEFQIFENGVAQEIAYFSGEEQPFTVALVLDMSYSSVFKLEEIQRAAFAFINQLRPQDRVMVVSFDEKARVLCEPTNNRKVLRLAIEGAKIASGTSLYTALDLVLNQKFAAVSGRKAIVLLSDGVDTSSAKTNAAGIVKNLGASDVLIYPIQYDTYEDVQKSRKENAQIFLDEDDRPIVVELPKEKGERETDYRAAEDFLKEISTQTGGRIFRVSSTTNLNAAFFSIAEELRKVYSLGYYPSEKRKIGLRYPLKVRVYRPNLNVRARDSYISK